MNSLDTLCFLIGFVVGCVSTVLMLLYKQKKALKLMQQMSKSKGNLKSVNDVTFVDVEGDVDSNG